MKFCAALILVLLAAPAFAEGTAAPSVDVMALISAIMSKDWSSTSVLLVGFLFAVFEWWIGRTQAIKPNSTLELVFTIIKSAVMGAIQGAKGVRADSPANTFPDGQQTGPSGPGGAISSQ